MDTPIIDPLPSFHSAATSTEGTPAPPSPRSSGAPSPAPDAGESKADARARRIAAAVVRSRTEYKPEHAYTERGVSGPLHPHCISHLSLLLRQRPPSRLPHRLLSHLHVS
jgi:hypothetical protein